MDYRDQMDGYALFSVGVEDATEAGVCGPYEPGTVLVYRATSLPIFGREIAAARDEAEAKDIVRQMIAGTYVSSLDWRRAVAQRAADDDRVPTLARRDPVALCDYASSTPSRHKRRFAQSTS